MENIGMATVEGYVAHKSRNSPNLLEFKDHDFLYQVRHVRAMGCLGDHMHKEN